MAAEGPLVIIQLLMYTRVSSQASRVSAAASEFMGSSWNGCSSSSPIWSMPTILVKRDAIDATVAATAHGRGKVHWH